LQWRRLTYRVSVEVWDYLLRLCGLRDSALEAAGTSCATKPTKPRINLQMQDLQLLDPVVSAINPCAHCYEPRSGAPIYLGVVPRTNLGGLFASMYLAYLEPHRFLRIGGEQMQL